MTKDNMASPQVTDEQITSVLRQIENAAEVVGFHRFIDLSRQLRALLSAPPAADPLNANPVATGALNASAASKHSKAVAATGFAWVPVEPTGVMKDAGAGSLPLGAGPWNAADCYRAMLAAAPQEQAPADKALDDAALEALWDATADRDDRVLAFGKLVRDEALKAN